MSRLIIAQFFFLMRLMDSQSLHWLLGLPDQSQITKCVGENVEFPWRYVLNVNEHLTGISWSRGRYGKQINFANFGFNKFITGLDRLSQVDGAAVKISNLTITDTDVYTVSVRLNDSRVSTQSVDLLVADVPATSSGRLNVMTLVNANGQNQLACGLFTTLGSPPVSVVWEDPEGNHLTSSSFQDGYFILDLADDSIRGNYICSLNMSLATVGCLAKNSTLREKSVVHISTSAAATASASSVDLSAGAAAGIGVALLLIIIIIIIAVVLFTKSKRGKSYVPKEPDSVGPDREAAEPLHT